MSSPAQRSRPAAWRLGRQVPGIVLILPYVLLAILASTGVSSRWGSVPVNLALCGLAAAWMLLSLHPRWWGRTPVMAMFVAGIIVITAVLVIRDPWFGFFTPAGYFYAIRLLPWPWQLPGVAAVAVLAATSQAAGVSKATFAGLAAYGGMIVLNAALMCGLAWLLHSSDQQHNRSEQALRQLSEANRRLAAALAENAGLHEQLLTQAREAGILDERHRMAREIHDTLAQGLTGIVTQLQAAEHAAEDPRGWRRHFAAATRLARESLTEARRSVDALRPEPLQEARLSDALAAVAGKWSALHGIAVQVTTTGTPRAMSPEAESALLRIAQEALANVAKHAQATRVGLTLSYLEHEVALDVRDDGKGFDLGQLNGSPPVDGGMRRAAGGFGLAAMRQRAEDLSGTLQIESEPGAGTGISASIPAAPVQAWA